MLPPMSPLLAIESMRVRRNYRGGGLLEARAGRAMRDTDRPEDWIASAVPAVNPGLPAEPGEGLTTLRAADGSRTTLAALLAAHGPAMLGPAHHAALGADLGFLAKLLDAGMRLHVQAHPTRDFARQRLGSPHGKLEAYVILAVRPGIDGWIRLGFQRSPGRDGWRRILERQDIAAMDACFAPIAVRPGETWLVPGGWPHAIGPGVLMLEVMEPSDLVVRCEFEREGIVVPPAGRFMGRDLEFCLDVFDYSERPPDEVRRQCRLAGEDASGVLVGPAHTPCFGIRRLHLAPGRAQEVARAGSIALCIAERGGIVLGADGAELRLGRLDAAIVPAATGGLVALAEHGGDLLVVQPGSG